MPNLDRWPYLVRALAAQELAVGQEAAKASDRGDRAARARTARVRGLAQELKDKIEKVSGIESVDFDGTNGVLQQVSVQEGQQVLIDLAANDRDVDSAIEILERKYSINNSYHKESVADGLVRILSPAVIREIRSDLSDQADNHGISVFSENLKNLLLQQFAIL